MAQPEGHLGRHDVARIRDAVLERQPTHPDAVGVVDLALAAVEPERPDIVDLGHGVDRLLLEGSGRGHHLEDRARLVDARNDGVDEARRVRRGDGLVVVGVVGRIARLGVDLAAVRVDHDGRDPLCPVGDPGGEELLLDAQLEAGIDRQPDIRAGHAGLGDVGRVHLGPAAGVSICDDDLGRAGERRLPGLLHAVLADAVLVDEAEEVRRESRLGATAGLRIDALRLRFERQPEDPACADGGSDLVRLGPLEAVVQDEVLARCRELVAQRGACRLVEPEDPGQLCDGGGSLVSGDQMVGRRDEPLSLQRGARTTVPLRS